jgi:curved DNA-binding protein CbpA
MIRKEVKEKKGGKKETFYLKRFLFFVVEETFRSIQKAYDILMDSEKRRDYDSQDAPKGKQL